MPKRLKKFLYIEDTGLKTGCEVTKMNSKGIRRFFEDFIEAYCEDKSEWVADYNRCLRESKRDYKMVREELNTLKKGEGATLLDTAFGKMITIVRIL